MGKQNKMKYYHNNRCRKSREGLEFLATKNLNPAVYEYMKNPLTKKELLNMKIFLVQVHQVIYPFIYTIFLKRKISLFMKGIN